MGSSPYTARVIRPAEYQTGPWKNGRGFSTEIAIHPPAANYARGDPFDWRVAIARIDPPGPSAPPGPIPFSPLPGKQRLMMLIEGDGVYLHHRYHHFNKDVRLTRLFETYELQGEWTTTCDLLGGPVRDFNVMVERANWRARLRAYTLCRGMTADPPLGDTTLFYCLRGVVGIYPSPAAEDFRVAAGTSLLTTRGKNQEEPNRVDITGRSAEALVIGVHLFRRGTE